MAGWKTIAVAIISGGLYFFKWDMLTQYVDAQLIALITSVLMILMRFLTDGPVAWKR